MQPVGLADHLDAEQVPVGAVALVLLRAGRLRQQRAGPQRALGRGPPGDLGQHAHPSNSRAAATVRSICSGVWASEGIIASNWLGAR